MRNRPPPNHPAYKTRPPHQVFPQEIDCVYDLGQGKGSIFIGNLQAAQNPETLKKHKISSLLTACKNIHIRHSKDHVPYSLYIPGQDHKDYDLSLHFETAADFIHQSLKETNILVHCMAGISRSATLVIAYLMKHKGMTMKEAFSSISRRRSKINPNPGFLKQLHKYEGEVLSKPSAPKHREYPTDKDNYRASLYMQRPSTYNPSGTPPRLSLYKPQRNYDKYYNRQNLELSVKKHNPETEGYSALKYGYPQSTKMPNYEQYSTKLLNQSKYNRSVQPFTNTTNFSTASGDKNVEALGRDLDDRINKIKQKYYERTGGFENKKIQMSKVDRNTNRLAIEELARSKAVMGRQSLRSSLYNYKNRPVSYNYVSFM